MQNYTPSTATYSDSISIVESSDAVNDVNANAAVKQLIENDITLKTELDLILDNSSKVTDVSGATATTTPGTKSVSLTWSDPDDIVVSGAIIAKWKGTKLVRKAGSAPSDETDGTVLLDNQVRDAYASSGYVDTNVEYGTTYYYRFFPYTALGSVTKGTSVTATPVKGIVSEPTVIGSFTYDGTEKTASVTVYDPDIISITGMSATNAGTYTATLHLIDRDYAWSDNTVADKTQTWTIDKANGSATLTPASVELGADNLSDTITVSDATGTVSGATSSDTSVCTASVSGNTVTVSSVDDNTGTATVTVSIDASANYKATTVTATVQCTFTRVYGVQWDGTSNPAWSRTDDAIGFTDPVPYVAGATSYSSPFDTLQPWAGMTKEERTGGTMVKIPKFWYKISQNGSGLKVQIADGPKEGFRVCPLHMDRGDGKGERDVAYLGRYHCGATAYKSATGQKPKVSVTRSGFRSSIHALGANIWQWDKTARFTLWLLYIVEYAHWNSQDKIGRGCSQTSSTSSAVFNMGYTDSMPYHTGTTQSSRTSYGGTQYRNIEGLWDNCYDWMDGCYYNSSGLNVILNPANFSDSSGGTLIGLPTSGYPSAFTLKDVNGAFPMFIPTASNGSDSTYSCDYWDFSASYPCLCVGGYCSQGLNHGLFCVNCSSASSTGAGIGSRLMELP